MSQTAKSSKKPADKSAPKSEDIEFDESDVALNDNHIALDDGDLDMSDSDHPLNDINPLPGDCDPEPHLIEKALIKRKADEERTDVDLLNDHAFYTCIVFQTHGQLQEFIAKTGWKLESEFWIDGFKLAKQLKIDIKPIPGFAAKRRLHTSREIPKAQREAISRGMSFLEP